MLKNIYSPMSGAQAQERVLDIIANNLANVNTVGFKGDRVTFTLQESEPEKNYKEPLPSANYKIDMEHLLPLRGNEMSYVGIADVHRDDSQGPAINTHDPLNVMIDKSGYMGVQTDEGIRYTRNGALSVSSDGVLSSKEGHPILGEKGDIVVRSGKFEINRVGEVWQDGQMVDKILLHDFEDTNAFERTGMNLFFYGGPPEGRTLVKDPQFKQGFLEGSNVNAIKNLTSMIVAHRSFEAYQKALSNYDSMMERSSNSIGMVRA